MSDGLRKSESGTQLLARLEGRTSLKDLEPLLFASEDCPVHGGPRLLAYSPGLTTHCLTSDSAFLSSCAEGPWLKMAYLDLWCPTSSQLDAPPELSCAGSGKREH
ncbi:DNA repair protein XRCC2 isoform X2 [Pseudophryne corroboree]|uniref:DNA repair protein XRCC2 isoform X2 n=1 Tax=Pseudophryne corroboree TaxID=495146 RepID=UPI003081C830